MPQTLLPRFLALVFLFALFTSAQSNAAGKAILIGISDYQSPLIPDLPGIIHDLTRMKTFSRTLGIDESNIVTLYNEQATRQGILVV